MADDIFIFDEKKLLHSTEEDSDEEILRWYDAGKPKSNIYEITHYDTVMRFYHYECYSSEIEKEYGDKLRWNIEVSYIYQIKDRYFRLSFLEASTENQENYFDDDDFIEVKKVEKIVKITEWEDI